MKTKKTLFYGLMLLPLAIVLIALLFLPDEIPMHYNLSGQVDRWGSKYEMLVFPALSVLYGGIMLGVAKYAAKHEESGQNNAQVCIVVGIMGNALFSAMTVFFLYAAFRQAGQRPSPSLDVYQIVFTILGLTMVVTGNLMPKLRKNALIGLRTPWSMKNEVTWKKSQRFGGICFLLGGGAVILSSLLTKGVSCLVWAMGILLAVSAAAVFCSWMAARKWG